MENVLKKLAQVKESLILYIIESAEKNQLSYLHTSYCDVDKVKLYHFEFDKKFYITEDVIYRLNSFSIEALADYCKRIHNDLNKVMWADNGHDYKLVNKINECYVENKQNFLEILQLIAQRDWLDIHCKFDWCDCYSVLTNIYFIENHATDILTHICDDKDLECIISYCRE